MKGKTMLNTAKTVALFFVDVAEILGPLMLFSVLFLLVGVYAY